MEKREQIAFSRRILARVSTLGDNRQPGATYWLDHVKSDETAIEHAQSKLNRSNIICWIDYFVQDIESYTLVTINPNASCNHHAEKIETSEKRTAPVHVPLQSLVSIDYDQSGKQAFGRLEQVLIAGTTPHIRDWISAYYQENSTRYRAGFPAILSDTTATLRSLIQNELTLPSERESLAYHPQDFFDRGLALQGS